MTRLELLHDDPGVTERKLPEEFPFLRLPFTFLTPEEALEPGLLLFGSQLKLSEVFLVLVRLGLTTCTRSGEGDLETAGAGSSAGCSLSRASESLSVA